MALPIRPAHLLFIATAPVYAANVDVHVTDSIDDGPVASAAVCLGTPANLSQFGARRTDSDGIASFQVAVETPLILTVTKPQFRSIRHSLPGKRTDRTVLVYLLRGGGGPICSAPAEASAAETLSPRTTILVEHCSINGGQKRTANRQVVLRCHVSGEPTHFRVSEQRDFADAEWQPHQPLVRVQLSAKRGKRTLYYQARRFSSVAGASLQTTSNIATASIDLE